MVEESDENVVSLLKLRLATQCEVSAPLSPKQKLPAFFIILQMKPASWKHSHLS